MKRSMMQVYVKNSAQAVELYKRAFDAVAGADYRNADGSCAHTELSIYGQILAVSETPDDLVCGNGMQFCLHFGEHDTDKVLRAWDALGEGAQIVCPVGECPYARTMFSLTDAYGVYWCVFA